MVGKGIVVYDEAKGADETRIHISFTDCKDCPYVGKTCKELICDHPKRIQLKPYAKDRKVNPEGIDNGCPIQERKNDPCDGCNVAPVDCCGFIDGACAYRFVKEDPEAFEKAKEMVRSAKNI